MSSDRNGPTVAHPNRRLRWAGLILVVLAAAVLASGIITRRSQATELRSRADLQAMPTVVVIHPADAAASATLELPGRIEAYARTPIYARISGYLKRWVADIGTPVKAGQLLAEIETPDLDQQLLQAQAELTTARSNAALATSTAKRWQALLATDSVSRQEADEKAGDLAAKQSVVNALQANLERVQALKRFARIEAPFDGVVTARQTDVGALINVGGAPGSELFVVSDLRKLRLYVNVPQAYVATLAKGHTAQLSVPERPGKTYPATVQSMAHAISAGSGSMLVQLAVDNRNAELLPGGYATVRFPMPKVAGALAVPPSALITGKDGLRVATVDAGDKVVVKPVTVSRDLGASIEIAAGLAPDDRVIESPPDGLASGDAVHVAAAAAATTARKARP